MEPPLSDLSPDATPPRPAAARPRSPVAGALRESAVVAGLALMALLWSGLAFFALFTPPLAGMGIVLAVLGLFLLRHARRGSGPDSARRRARLRLRPVPGRALPWLAVLGVLVVVLQLSIAALVFSLKLVEVPPTPQFITDYLARPWGWTVLVAVAVLLAPVVEEFFFRGKIQGRLERRLGPAWAIAVTAAVFALAHFQLAGLANRFVGGVVLGFAVYATRSIWAGVLLHMAWNGGISLLAALAPDADPTKGGAAWALPAAAVLAAALAGTVWAGRKLWDETRGRPRDVRPTNGGMGIAITAPAPVPPG